MVRPLEETLERRPFAMQPFVAPATKGCTRQRQRFGKSPKPRSTKRPADGTAKANALGDESVDATAPDTKGLSARRPHRRNRQSGCTAPGWCSPRSGFAFAGVPSNAAGMISAGERCPKSSSTIRRERRAERAGRRYTRLGSESRPRSFLASKSELDSARFMRLGRVGSGTYAGLFPGRVWARGIS
jgi:hypothetical protein